MKERVLMWGEDTYDDCLTAKQGSQDVEHKGTRGGHFTPVAFNVIVNFNEQPSIYLNTGFNFEKAKGPTEPSRPTSDGKLEGSMYPLQDTEEGTIIPYDINWRIGSVTGKMVLAFDPKARLKEGICHTIQAVYNPNLRLSQQEYATRPYEHPAWDRDIDIQVDHIYDKYCEKLIRDVRIASRQINTILGSDSHKTASLAGQARTAGRGVMETHIQIIEQWITSMFDTRKEPSVHNIIHSPGYLETWGATRFLLHELPVDTSKVRWMQEENSYHTSILARFWEDYGWIGPLTEQETQDVTATLVLHNTYISPNTTQEGYNTNNHIMFKRVCHRAGYAATDPRIQPVHEAPEVDTGMPDEGREQRKEARRANQERKCIAQASISWIQAIPTLLGLRELTLQAKHRKQRRMDWTHVCTQLRDVGGGQESQPDPEERQAALARVFIERHTTKEEYPVRYSHQEGVTLRKGKAHLSTLTNTKVLAARHVVKVRHSKQPEEEVEARRQYSIQSTLNAFTRIQEELKEQILQKIAQLVSNPTRATKAWALLMLARVSPRHTLVDRTLKAKILRKPKTLKYLFPLEQRERDLMDNEYCYRSLEQARRRAEVDPQYQTYRRVTELIRDQHVRYVDPMAVESPAQMYAASKEVHGIADEDGETWNHHANIIGRKIQRKEPLTVQEEIAFSTGKYELAPMQIAGLTTRD